MRQNVYKICFIIIISPAAYDPGLEIGSKMRRIKLITLFIDSACGPYYIKFEF